MPSDIPQEEDTIFRNIRLITTPWNIFVFIISPLLCWLWILFSALYLIRKVGHRTGVALFTFTLAIYPCCVLFLAMATAEKITARLESLGYEQRRTRARELDLLLNLGILGAFYYWTRRQNGEDWESAWALGVLWVGIGFALWWFVVMVSIGPVIWFTVKVR